MLRVALAHCACAREYHEQEHNAMDLVRVDMCRVSRHVSADREVTEACVRLPRGGRVGQASSWRGGGAEMNPQSGCARASMRMTGTAHAPGNLPVEGPHVLCTGIFDLLRRGTADVAPRCGAAWRCSQNAALATCRMRQCTWHRPGCTKV
jgi:hypothetical protein